MSLLAATTMAALLVSSPSTTEADRIAANGGFLLGNAHRCGVATDRVVRAGQVVHKLILAAVRDDKEEEAATGRMTAFFLVSAFPDPGKEKLIAACNKVNAEFAAFEQHAPAEPPAEDNVALGGGDKPNFRPGDGE